MHLTGRKTVHLTQRLGWQTEMQAAWTLEEGELHGTAWL